MYSIHNVKDIMTVRANWKESEPKKWKLVSVEGTKISKNDYSNYPKELQESINNFDVIINGIVDGTILKTPDDLVDFESQNLTENQTKVLKTLMKDVPRGTIISYKELGEKAGVGPNAARFVGNTMHLNHWVVIIPCHRVVRTDYSLGNYSTFGPLVKEKLLKEEGITIKNHFCKPPITTV